MTTGVLALKQAIGRAFETVPGVVGGIGNFDNPKAPLTADLLPGYFVNGASQARHEKHGASEVTTTRTFFVVLIVAGFADNDPVAHEAAFALMDDYLDTVPLVLLKHGVLVDSSGDQLPDVAGITSLIDDLPEEITREHKRYVAIPYRVAVTINRTFN